MNLLENFKRRKSCDLINVASDDFLVERTARLAELRERAKNGPDSTIPASPKASNEFIETYEKNKLKDGYTEMYGAGEILKRTKSDHSRGQNSSGNSKPTL